MSEPRFEDYLTEVFEKKASDLHVSAGSPVMIRIDGDLKPSDLAPDKKFTVEEALAMCLQFAREGMREEFEKNLELDYSFAFENKCRFRANVFMQMGTPAGAFRPIPNRIPTMEELDLPPVFQKLVRLPRGLILVTGPTGSGKSTTLSSMIDAISKMGGYHILTIEDPVEFVYTSGASLIAQREVGKDTNTFQNALKYALRQDPDVVLIGEMRDLETVAAALTISETGHLVMGTLHTNSAVETINRILDVFEPHQQSQVRTQLSFVLQAVVSQQLVPKIGGGRVMAQEIMVPNFAIRNLIRDDKVHQIYTSMQLGQKDSGMMTLNQSLALLVKKGIITKEQAIDKATQPDEVAKLLGLTLS